MRPLRASSSARRSPVARPTARNTRNGHNPMRISVRPKEASGSGHHDVRIGYQARAARQRGPLHRGHYRLPQARPRAEEALVNIGLSGVFRLERFVQIHARAERRPPRQ